MKTISIQQAKADFSHLLRQVAQGKSFIVTKYGRPIARLEPVGGAKTQTVKRLGFMAGQFSVPPDFDHMGTREIESLFGMSS